AILSNEINSLAASKVTAGTFDAGNFTFQDNLTALGILNSTGTSFNNTFYGDIRINGTLYGFAPLRIGTGLNITGDLNVTGGTVNFPSGYLTTFNGGINGINMNFTGSTNFATSGGRVGILNNLPNATLHITGLANVLALNVNNTLYVNTTKGNVGIGTASPDRTSFAAGTRVLTIESNTSTRRGALELVGPDIADTGTIGTIIGIHNDAGTFRLLSAIDMIRDGGTDSGTIYFRTSNAGTLAERMRITAAGNVGINTVSPNATLQVNGSFGIINATTGAFLMYVNSTTGNVGIGTTAPSGSLHVDRTGGGNTIRINTSAPHGWMTFSNNTGIKGYLGFGSDGHLFSGAAPGSLALRAENALHLGANANSLIMTLNNSKVGIGTTTPNYTLEVAQSTSYLQFGQNIATGGSGPTLVLGASNNVYSDLLFAPFIASTNVPGADAVYLRGSSYGLAIHSINNGKASLNINFPDTSLNAGLYVNGSVGIGTNSPGSKLEVENTVGADDVLLLEDSSGLCEAQPTTTGLTWSCSSDIRLKSNIRNASPVLGYIAGIPLRDYTVIKTGENATGPIAQDLLKTNPELVRQGDDGYYQVSELSQWALVKAVQELKEENDGLKRRISALETKMK
ncbi:MAG: tail fiber domain-containing protein, partial [Candidatus Aenigmarchaeota archaeon]|nr:tail fiber domain-containing protein [Candidatus Aenigmarchaeota archaeon]